MKVTMPHRTTSGETVSRDQQVSIGENGQTAGETDSRDQQASAAAKLYKEYEI